MMVVKIFVASIFFSLCGLIACGWSAARISVFVSIPPQQYFVQQIGKDRVDVQVLLEPGADPHTYEPKPRQMAALSKAILYFTVGIAFEKAKLKNITAMNPHMRVVATDHGIMKLPPAMHGPRGGDTQHKKSLSQDEDDDIPYSRHGHEGRDPHIWLSPPLVMMQARSMLIALQEVDPAHRSIYESNYRQFIGELVELDAHLRAVFDGLRGSAFMVVHPSWGTFAHTYGLRQIPVEIEGKRPKPAQLEALIEQARSLRIKVIFVQPQFSPKSAWQIANAIGGQTAVVDPLAPDWATNLRQVAEVFKHAIE
jgi:zinc transport system substrate-binding protein